MPTFRRIPGEGGNPTDEERIEVLDGGAGPQSRLSDHELFEAAVGGDTGAIEEWYRRYPGRELPISGLMPTAPTVKSLAEMSDRERHEALFRANLERPLTKEEKRSLGGLRSLAEIRRARILELKVQGYTQAEIAQTLGMTTRAVGRNLQELVSKPAAESTELLRQQTTARLDKLLAAAWPYALGLAPGQEKPDWEAMSKCLEIERDRRKLLGLDAPEKIDVRMLVHQIAEVRGYSSEQTEQAVMFVESMLREMRGVLG